MCSRFAHFFKRTDQDKPNFRVEFSDKLKEQINIMKTNRKTLEELKEGKYTSLGSRLSGITKFIIETEQKHGFILTPSQRETVIFGIYGRKILIANPGSPRDWKTRFTERLENQCLKEPGIGFTERLVPGSS